MKFQPANFKLFTILLIYNFYPITSYTAYEINVATLATAIAEVCEEFFVKKSAKFDVIVYGQLSWHLFDIVDAFMQILGNKSAIIIQFIGNSNKFVPQFDKSAVLFFPDEISMFEFTESPVLVNKSPVDFKFLVYTDKVPNQQPILAKYPHDITFARSYFYFFLNDENDVHFWTYDHFTRNNCNIPMLQSLNKFNKFTMLWEKKLKYHKKFQNFNDCPLLLYENFGQFFHFEYQNHLVWNCLRTTRDMDCTELSKKLIAVEKADGIFVEIFKIIAKKANFSPKFSIISGFEKYAEQSRIPTVHIFIGTLLNNLNENFFPTAISLNSHYMFAVTPTEFYNNYEKLWLPFDDVTWALLLLTFLVAFVTIFILNFVPERFKILFYGGIVHSPALNVIHIFFGISQMKLPDASVPRAILLLFITYCLIFRTCYQSELFEFMTSDMRKPPPDDVEDLIDRNYTFVACNGYQFKVLKDFVGIKSDRYCSVHFSVY